MATTRRQVDSPASKCRHRQSRMSDQHLITQGDRHQVVGGSRGVSAEHATQPTLQRSLDRDVGTDRHQRDEDELERQDEEFAASRLGSGELETWQQRDVQQVERERGLAEQHHRSGSEEASDESAGGRG